MDTENFRGEAFSATVYAVKGPRAKLKRDNIILVPYRAVCCMRVVKAALYRADRAMSNGTARGRSPAAEFARCLTGERQIKRAFEKLESDDSAWLAISFGEAQGGGEGSMSLPECPIETGDIDNCANCTRGVAEFWGYDPADLPGGSRLSQLVMEKGASVVLDRRTRNGGPRFSQ